MPYSSLKGIRDIKISLFVGMQTVDLLIDLKYAVGGVSVRDRIMVC
jgi:hypothetical protein